MLFSRKLGVQVKVIDVKSENRIKVKCGSITTEVTSDDLYYCKTENNIQKNLVFAKTDSGLKRKSILRRFNNEINVIGQTVDEAIANVDAFIDSAVLSGVSQLWVIHGMGTGKLRAGLHAHFKNIRTWLILDWEFTAKVKAALRF